MASFFVLMVSLVLCLQGCAASANQRDPGFRVALTTKGFQYCKRNEQ